MLYGGGDLLWEAAISSILVSDMAQNVLHHEHSAVHNHAEIERAQREQVGRNVAQIQ